MIQNSKKAVCKSSVALKQGNNLAHTIWVDWARMFLPANFVAESKTSSNMKYSDWILLCKRLIVLFTRAEGSDS